jgi:nucleotide-binding universal stress UspA family protein
MKRFSNIVFVSESEECDQLALKQATALAKSNQAQLTVIAYFDNLSSIHKNQPETNLLMQELLKHKQEQLNQNISQYTQGIETEVKVFFGKPFIEIIREVIEFDRDLLIKSIEQTKGIGSVVFGSLDFKLLRKCPCPVWLIKPFEQQGYKEIVVAIDYEPDNTENEALNKQMLTMAVSLSLSEFSELHVVHAWELAHESFLRSSRMHNSKEEVDAMVVAEEKKRSMWLKEIIDKSTSHLHPSTNQYVNPQLHVIKGQAKYVIPEFTKNLGAELIIMGTVGRSGIPGYIIGNTAETILNSISCSVLAVKPKDFICPINLA